MVDKTPQVTLGLIIGHTGIAEMADDAIHADHFTDRGQLVEHLVGSAPGHELCEVPSGALLAMTPDVVPDFTVKLIALEGTEVVGGHLIVLHCRPIIAADVL